MVLSVPRSHTHELKDLRQFLEGSGLERRLDQTTSKEVHSFNTILTVSDIATLDADHLHDRVENGSLEEGVCRKANGNNCTTGTCIVNSLLERLLGDSE